MPESRMDMWYTAMLIIYDNAEQMISVTCLLFLNKDFIGDNSRFSKKRQMTMMGIVYFFVYMLIYSVPGVGGFATNAAALAVTFLLCIWMDRENLRTKLFLFSVFLVVRFMVSRIPRTYSYYLFEKVDKVIYGISGIEDPFLQTYYFISFCVNCLTDMIIFGVLLFWAVREIRKRFENNCQDMEWQELFFLMIPVVNSVVARSLLQSYNKIYEEETGSVIYQTHPIIELRWTVFYVITMISIVSVTVLYQRIRRQQEEERARLMLESQMRDMQSHIAEVERLYINIRGVKHDIKNHVDVINSLLDQGKANEARMYAKTLSETAEAFDLPIKTGNPVTDVILREKMNLAAEQNIEFLSDFHYPADMEIDAFDVSVILSNALSNAIEAAEQSKKGKYVRLSSFRNKNAYLITVENSFERDLEIDSESGFPRTGKRDKWEHGFGLQNIRSVASKYYGDIQIEQRGPRVILTVMLMIGTEK